MEVAYRGLPVLKGGRLAMLDKSASRHVAELGIWPLRSQDFRRDLVCAEKVLQEITRKVMRGLTSLLSHRACRNHIILAQSLRS